MKFKNSQHIFSKVLQILLLLPLSLLYTQDVEPPSTPKNFYGLGDGGAVRLYWAKNSDRDLSKYVLYKGEVKWGWANQLATVNKTNTSYFDYNVVNNQTYYYSISAIDSSGNISARTNQIKVTPIPLIPIYSARYGNKNEEVIVILNSEEHENYGYALPVTYKIRFPAGSSPYNVLYKYQENSNYSSFDLKEESAIFNNITAARIDLKNSIVYTSIGFSSKSDSLFIKIVDVDGNAITPQFDGIAKYYDNRSSVVVASADDWHQFGNDAFVKTINEFRNYNIPLTVGIITDESTLYSAQPKMTPETWKSIQNQIDFGNIEIASHSRNHLSLPYPDIWYEVNGSKEDIINNLTLPSMYTNSDKEYVYIWIAPGGSYSPSIERALGQSKYLGARGYVFNRNYITKWNPYVNLFDLFGFTVEIGNVPWPGGETNEQMLKDQFDKIINNGEVYHFMCHPSHIQNDWDNQPYLKNFLSYISNRKDIWYTTLGHLYLYQKFDVAKDHFLDINQEDQTAHQSLQISNRPNPFNSTTMIEYNIVSDNDVELSIYNLLGEKVHTLVDGKQKAGTHFVTWNGKDKFGQTLNSGVYLCTLTVGNSRLTKKMILLK